MNFSKIISLLLLLISVAFASCNKSEGEEDPTTNPDDNQKMQLVTDLNGFKFEGSFKEPTDPDVFSFVFCKYVEEYDDGIRAVFYSYDNLNQDYRWYIRELEDGKIVQEFNTIHTRELSPESYIFAFDNSNFLLYGFEKASSVIVTFKPDGTKSAYHVSKPNNNFPYRFDENYTVFWGNASSVYVHENKNNSFTPPAPSMGYLLTNEPSVAFANYLLDDDIVNPYSFRENIYTAFFNATYDKGNYIGIAKGSVTLDTLVVNKYDPSLYYSGNSGVYISKAGNKYYLSLFKIKTKYGKTDVSLYEMDADEKVIRPLYMDKDIPFTTAYQFVNGKFYSMNQVFNTEGKYETLTFPKFVDGVSSPSPIFGKTKMFLVVRKDVDLIEIYSKPY
jgi:hypothetical protein